MLGPAVWEVFAPVMPLPYRKSVPAGVWGSSPGCCTSKRLPVCYCRPVQPAHPSVPLRNSVPRSVAQVVEVGPNRLQVMFSAIPVCCVSSAHRHRPTVRGWVHPSGSELGRVSVPGRSLRIRGCTTIRKHHPRRGCRGNAVHLPGGPADYCRGAWWRGGVVALWGPCRDLTEASPGGATMTFVTPTCPPPLPPPHPHPHHAGDANICGS
jgi:hypothetical protein